MNAKALRSQDPKTNSSPRTAFALGLAVSFLVSGCVTSRVEEFKQSETGIAEGESVVILSRQHHNTHEAEEKFTRCVSESLDKGKTRVSFYPGQDFMDDLYPWFEPTIAPLTTEDLPKVLSKPGVSEKIARSGVRYLIWVDGATDRVDGGGGLSCAAGPAGAGCFGLAWWETDSKYEAAVWDLSDATSAGTISTDVSGRSVMPAIIIPMPFIARTQAAACKGLANQIKTFLTVEESGEPT